MSVRLEQEAHSELSDGHDDTTLLDTDASISYFLLSHDSMIDTSTALSLVWRPVVFRQVLLTGPLRKGSSCCHIRRPTKMNLIIELVA